MAEFDPQQPGDNEEDEKRASEQSGSRQWEYENRADGRSCCSGDSDCELPDACEADLSRDGHRDAGLPHNESFVSDWASERPSELQPTSFDTPSYGSSSYETPAETSSFEPRRSQEEQPEKFWVDLVNSQLAPELGDVARTADEGGRPAQSGQYWSEMGGAAPKPSGMGWNEDEASEWSPPARDERVDAAAEPVESMTQSRRDDVEWGTPASAQDEWSSVRSEALGADSKSEGMMAAQPEKKAKAKAKTAGKKKATAKTAKGKKKAAAKKKPAKKAAAKKKTAKKLVKKPATTEAAPTVTTEDPERRAA
jgi:hypothetical protein